MGAHVKKAAADDPQRCNLQGKAAEPGEGAREVRDGVLQSIARGKMRVVSCSLRQRLKASACRSNFSA